MGRSFHRWQAQRTERQRCIDIIQKHERLSQQHRKIIHELREAINAD
jgi:hypothetical protein